MQSSNSLASSILLAGFTLFAISKTTMSMYNQHSKKMKLTQFIEVMRSYEDGLLEQYSDNHFSQLINKDDPNFNDLDIKLIGGNNNKVYMVTNNEIDQDLAVFRVVDNDHSLTCYDRLIAHKLGQFVATRHALIPLSYTNRKKGVIGSFLEVSEYFSTGNLEDYIMTFQGSLQNRQEESLNYFVHIVEMLEKLNNANVYFADLKTSNLFIKNNGKIALADLKSLVIFDPEERKNYKKPLVLTISYLPPELLENGKRRLDVDFDLDALQSYQLGLCLYEILTGDFALKINRNTHDEPLFIFDHPVFKGEKGCLLRNIICDLTHPDPKLRLSITHVWDKYNLSTQDTSSIDYRSNPHYFYKKYQELLESTNQSRLHATLAICDLKDTFYQNAIGDLINKKNNAPVNDDSFDHHVEVVRNLVMKHHQFKDQLKKLAFQYNLLNMEQKLAYWSCQVTVEESYRIVEGYDLLVHSLFKKFENDYVLSDLFQALHLPVGRELIFKLIELLIQQNKTINMIEGTTIQINYSVADEIDKRELSAKSNVNLLIDNEMTLSDFNQLLDMAMEKGNPEVITDLALQYPDSWSIGFADTMNTKGTHDYYLMDTSITLLHEIGHVIALLGGEFVVSQYCNILPGNLQPYYHELEEYLNIEKRTNAESKIDPMGFKRIGHTGYEIASLNRFTTSNICDYLLDERVLANKEKMIAVYQRASKDLVIGQAIRRVM